MELAYFCSVDQHLMLFKHVENREEIWGYMYMYMYMGIYVYKIGRASCRERV